MHDVKYNSEIASRQNPKNLGYLSAKALNFDEAGMTSKEYPRKLGLKDSPFFENSLKVFQASNLAALPSAGKTTLLSEKKTQKSLKTGVFQKNLRPITIEKHDGASLASSFNKITLFENQSIEEVDSAGSQIKPAAQKWLIDNEKQKGKDTVYKSFLKNQQLFHERFENSGKSLFSKSQILSQDSIRNPLGKSIIYLPRKK